MGTIFDVFPEDLLEAVADKLKASYPGVEAPKEAMYWKTASFKEIPPIDFQRFWLIRSASIMRKLYRGPIGVNRLKKAYGGRIKSTVHLEHSSRGSGAILRRILQQLEKAKLVKKAEKKGRTLTNEGRSLLDKSAADILKKERTLSQ
jgi:small subunit ribosomal protein S19e